eukprot:2283055-Prymnesium_polylepis.1
MENSNRLSGAPHPEWQDSDPVPLPRWPSKISIRCSSPSQRTSKLENKLHSNLSKSPELHQAMASTIEAAVNEEKKAQGWKK